MKAMWLTCELQRYQAGKSNFRTPMFVAGERERIKGPYDVRALVWMTERC